MTRHSRLLGLIVSVFLVFWGASCVPHLHRAAVPKLASVHHLLPKNLFSPGETVLLVPIWMRSGGGSTLHDPKNQVHLLGPLAITPIESVDEVFARLRGPRNLGVAYFDARGGDVAGKVAHFEALLLVAEGGTVAFMRWWGSESWDVFQGRVGSSWTDQLVDLLVEDKALPSRPHDQHILCHLSTPVALLDTAGPDQVHVGDLLARQEVDVHGSDVNAWQVVTKKSGWSSLCGETLNRDDQARPAWAPTLID